MNGGTGALYDRHGRAIGKAPAFLSKEGIGGLLPVVGQVLCTEEQPTFRGMDRVWLLPAAGCPKRLPSRIAGELVAALEVGMAVAILGADWAEVTAASAAVMQLVGGFDA